MKSIFLCILLSLIVISCNNGKSAEDYYKSGVEKANSHRFSKDRVSAYKAAMLDLDKAISLNPKYVEAYSDRALLKRALGDYKGSIEDAVSVTVIDPQNEKAFYFIGQSRWMHHDFNGSIKAFTQAIAIKPEVANFYYQRGLSEKDANYLNAALKDFSKAIEISSTNDPFLKDYYTFRGAVKVELNDSSACADFYKALALGDTSAQSFIDNHCK